MSTAGAICVGAVFGAGLFTFVVAVVGRMVDDDDDRPARRWPVAPGRIDRLPLRACLATAAGTAIWAITAWPVGLCLAAAGGFASPALLRRRAHHSRHLEGLDAIATWTEQLRDVMAAAAGLEGAIAATAAHAPAPIRADIARLATELDTGGAPRTALMGLADRLDDPAGDLVVAALILAAEGSPRRVGDLLGRLAETTRDTVRMRLRVETGRARARSTVRVVTTVTVAFSVGIVLLNPSYVSAYRGALGQIVLVLVAAFFAAAYLWLAREERPVTAPRFLTADPRRPAEALVR